MNLQIGPAHYGGNFAATPMGSEPLQDAGQEGLPQPLPQLLPFVLPGELIDPVSHAVLQASPDRAVPGCDHFGLCGGCQYQHATYPAQLKLKAGILRDLLDRELAQTGLDGLPVPTTHAAEPWHYRNRIRLRVESVAGTARVGYSRRGTNEFLPIHMCPIAAPLLWRAAEAMTALAAAEPLAARWFSRIAELELFFSPQRNGSRSSASSPAEHGDPGLQIQFLLRSAEGVEDKGQQFADLCALLKERIPELAGAGAMLDPELSRRQRRTWAGASWGAPGLSYPVAGRDYWVSRGAFFQVNRFLLETLVKLVAGDRQGELAWDLFAGVGLFSRPLAERFQRVVAVEGGRAAAVDLANSTRGLKIHAVHSPTLDFLKMAALQRERPELIVLDPPRAGLGAEGAALLARIASPEIVYVSCDPVTLARDLATLLSAGYRAASIDLIDLFPQTFHLETVVILRKR